MKANFRFKERPLGMYYGKGILDPLYSTVSGSWGSFNPAWNITVESAPEWRLNYFVNQANLTSPTRAIGLDLQGYEKIEFSTGQVHNYCDHTKVQSICLPFYAAHRDYYHLWPPVNWWDPPTVYFEPYYRFSVPGNLIWDRSIDGARSMLQSMEDDLSFSSRAYWSMRPKFQSDVSMVNTVLELKDFKDLLPLGKKILDLRKDANLVKAAKLVKKRLGMLGTVPDALATAILTVNLAIKPTIADFGAVCNVINQDLQAKFDNFVEYGQEGSRSHYSERGVLNRNVQVGYNNAYWYGPGTQHSWKKTASSISYFDYKTRDAVALTKKFYGLEWDAGKIWNSLPLSFVADYFLKIGDALEMMTVDPDVHLRGQYYCESIKVKYGQGQYFVPDDRLVGIVVDGDPWINCRTSDEALLVTGLSRVVYRRVPKEPYKGPALPRWSLPSFNQWSNLASLAWLFSR